MPNIRVFPYPNSPIVQQIPGTGRKYLFAGAFLDVPDFDAVALANMGNLLPADRSGLVGTTAQRPTNPAVGDQYIDTTFGGNIMWNGRVWVFMFNGSPV